MFTIDTLFYVMFNIDDAVHQNIMFFFLTPFVILASTCTAMLTETFTVNLFKKNICTSMIFFYMCNAIVYEYKKQTFYHILLLLFVNKSYGNLPKLIHGL